MLPLEVDIFNRFKKVKEADVNAPNTSVALNKKSLVCGKIEETCQHWSCALFN
jgi:hypothetical protein